MIVETLYINKKKTFQTSLKQFMFHKVNDNLLDNVLSQGSSKIIQVDLNMAPIISVLRILSKLILTLFDLALFIIIALLQEPVAERSELDRGVIQIYVNIFYFKRVLNMYIQLFASKQIKIKSKFTNYLESIG